MTKSKNWPQVASSTPHAGPGGFLVTIWLISRKENRFGVAGMSDGTPIHGEVITHRGGGLEYKPKESMPALDSESQAYESLCNILGDCDPGWASSFD